MKTLIYISLVLVFCFANNICADVYWDKTFGGSDYDQGFSVAVCNDGGYIITGDTESYGAGIYDIFLIKTDAAGNVQWYKIFGGADYDHGRSVIQCNDSGFIIAGGTYNTTHEYWDLDVWLIKTDAAGNMQWDKTFGGIDDEWALSAAQCSDNGYIIVGNYQHYVNITNIWLIKTDEFGNCLWDKNFGGTNYDYGRSVKQCSDNGFIIVGTTGSYGPGWSDVWMIKTDLLGNMLWDKTFDKNSEERGSSVTQCNDDGFIITGWTNSDTTSWSDVWLIKTDADGNKLWDKTFGGTGDDNGFSVAQCTDEGYIITGSTNYFGYISYDVLLIKTDVNGNKQWDKTFGGSDDDCGYSVDLCSDGGYIITGFTESYGAGQEDVWLIYYYHEEYETSISDFDLLSAFLIILSLSSLLFLKRKKDLI